MPVLRFPNLYCPNVSQIKPNIVFVLVDNLGWGEIGVYGGGILRACATHDLTDSLKL